MACSEDGSCAASMKRGDGNDYILYLLSYKMVKAMRHKNLRDLPSLQSSRVKCFTEKNTLVSQVTLVATNLPANAGDVTDTGSIPGSGGSPGGGHSNPLKYSCSEDPMDRGVWQAAIHRVGQSWTQLSMQA